MKLWLNFATVGIELISLLIYQNANSQDIMNLENVLNYNPKKIKIISEDYAKNLLDGKQFQTIEKYGTCYHIFEDKDFYILEDCSKSSFYLSFPTKEYLLDYIDGNWEFHEREIIYYYYTDYGFEKPRVASINKEKNINQIIKLFEAKYRSDLSDLENTVYQLNNNCIFEVSTSNKGDEQFGSIFEKEKDYKKYLKLLNEGNLYSISSFVFDPDFADNIDLYIDDLSKKLEIEESISSFSENDLLLLTEKCYDYNDKYDLWGLDIHLIAYMCKYVLENKTNSTLIMKEFRKNNKSYIHPVILIDEQEIDISAIVVNNIERIIEREYFPLFYFNY